MQTHSIKEIASHLGVSVATISRALDPAYSGKVREATRKRILSYCERLNYRPNASGRSCSTGRTYKIGFISGDPLSDFGNINSGRHFLSACRELQQRGYTALVLCAEGNDLEQSVVNMLRSQVADVYIIGGTLITDAVRSTIVQTGCKVVAPNGSTSLLDNASSIERDYGPAFREIWSKVPSSWSEAVGFCGPVNENTQEKFQAALLSAPPGMTIRPIDIAIDKVRYEHTRYASYRQAMAKMEELRSCRLLWCCSDLTALGICDALHEAGLVIGRDISVVGFDNLERVAPLPDAPGFLSTVDSMQEENGRLSVELALELLATGQPRHIKLPLKFIGRQTF